MKTGQRGKGRITSAVGRRDVLRWLGLGPAAIGAGLAPRADAAPPGGGTTPSWTIGGNVAVYDWAPSPFVDIVKSSRGFGRHGEFDENLALARDAAGWPAEPSEIVITAAADRPGTEWLLGTWKGRFKGTGRLLATSGVFVNGTIQNIKTKGDTTTFDWNVTAAPSLALRFDGPIRDLRLVRPGFSLDNPPLLHPDALSYYKQFHALRFLDFMGQNDTEARSEASWSQRQVQGKFHGRKSWEAMAEFFKACYQASGSKTRAIWWNVPFRFNEADCLALGQRLASLLPGGAIKMPEFSNELWNSGYGAKWAHYWTRANDPLDPDYARINSPETSDPYERLARLWMLQVARMGRAMKAAFPGAFGRTLHPVMAGQFQNITWHDTLGLPWLARAEQTAEFGAPKTFISSLAAAPYLMGTLEEMDAAPDVAAMQTGLRTGFAYSLAQVVPQLVRWTALQAAYGFARLDAYEWQLHLNTVTNRSVAYATTFAPEAGVLVKDLAYAMRDAGFRQLCYLYVSPQVPLVADENSFLWSLNTSFAGPRTAKGQAVVDLIAQTGQ